MKDFLSEYGFAILAAIVVILLIAMCTPVGNLIKNQVLGVVDSFAGKTEAKLAAIDDDGAIKVVLKQAASGAGKFEVTATSASKTDKLAVEYRVKDQHGNWGNWVDLSAKGASGATKFLTDGVFDHAGGFTAVIQDGNDIQVRVYDQAKDASIFYESNIVKYAGATQATGADIDALGA